MYSSSKILQRKEAVNNDEKFPVKKSLINYFLNDDCLAKVLSFLPITQIFEMDKGIITLNPILNNIYSV